MLRGIAETRPHPPALPAKLMESKYDILKLM